MSDRQIQHAAASSPNGFRKVKARSSRPVNLKGRQTVDGVELEPGDLVLHGGGPPALNGIYIVTEGPWWRMPTPPAVRVEEGVVDGETSWATGV